MKLALASAALCCLVLASMAAPQFPLQFQPHAMPGGLPAMPANIFQGLGLQFPGQQQAASTSLASYGFPAHHRAPVRAPHPHQGFDFAASNPHLLSLSAPNFADTDFAFRRHSEDDFDDESAYDDDD